MIQSHNFCWRLARNHQMMSPFETQGGRRKWLEGLES
uniref:Uncharacterized protein n=1 Tax=Lotus japonicus TaxID=34305 RepID=I3SVX7_LOTJA|nr:unknown [Lotus japonicus]